MSVPIEQQILDHLVQTLQGMTVAGGFAWDVQPTSVVTDPVNLLTVPASALPMFQVEIDPTAYDRKYELANQVRVQVGFTITVRMDAEGNDYGRKTALQTRLRANLEQALAVDTSRGNLVADTRTTTWKALAGIGSENIVIVVQDLITIVHRADGQP